MGKGGRVAAGLRLSDKEFVWVLGSLCQLHRVPFDPAVLLQQFPPPYDRTALFGAAKALEFKVGERAIGSSCRRCRCPAWHSSPPPGRPSRTKRTRRRQPRSSPRSSSRPEKRNSSTSKPAVMRPIRSRSTSTK